MGSINLIEEMNSKENINIGWAIFEFVSVLLILAVVVIAQYSLKRKNKKMEQQCIEEINRTHPELNVKNIQDLCIKSISTQFFFSEDDAIKEKDKIEKQGKIGFCCKNDKGCTLFIF